MIARFRSRLHTVVGEISPHVLIVRVLISALVIQLLISYRLWLPIDRSFPTVSLLEGMPVVFGFGGDLLLMILLLASALLLAILPTSRFALLGFTLAAFCLVFEDINRLQPWFWFTTVILWLLPRPPRKGPFVDGTTEEGVEVLRRHALFPSAEESEAFRHRLRIILSGLYVWSGIWKINPAFVDEVVPRFFEAFGLAGISTTIPAVAWLVPLVEITGGFLLLLPRRRRIGVILLTGLHAAIVLVLLLMNWNHVVIPWNVALIFLLFISSGVQEMAAPRGRRLIPSLVTAILLFWILPSLRIVGLWDAYLSGELYSGINVEAIFTYHESDRPNLPPIDSSLLYFRSGTEEEFLTLGGWCADELGVPMYPEVRVALRAGATLCERLARPEAAGVSVSVREPFSGREYLVRRGCGPRELGRLRYLPYSMFSP